MCWGRRVPLFRNPLIHQGNAAYMQHPWAVTGKSMFIAGVQEEQSGSELWCLSWSQTLQWLHPGAPGSRGISSAGASLDPWACRASPGPRTNKCPTQSLLLHLENSFGGVFPRDSQGLFSHRL